MKKNELTDSIEGYISNAEQSRKRFTQSVKFKESDSFEEIQPLNEVKPQQTQQDHQTNNVEILSENLNESHVPLTSSGCSIEQQLQRERIEKNRDRIIKMGLISSQRIKQQHDKVETKYILDFNKGEELEQLYKAICQEDKNQMLITLLKRSLGQLDLFKQIESSIPSDYYMHLFSHLSARIVKKGEVILQIGEESKQYYFILKGSTYILYKNRIESMINYVDQQDARIDEVNQNSRVKENLVSKETNQLSKNNQQTITHNPLIENNPVDSEVNHMQKFVTSTKRLMNVRALFGKKGSQGNLYEEEAQEGEQETGLKKLVEMQMKRDNLAKGFFGKQLAERKCIELSSDLSKHRDEIKKEFQEFQIVGTYESGEGFGILPLLNSTKQTETIISKEDTFLIILEKPPFLRFLGGYYDRKYKEKIDFISSLFIFESLQSRIQSFLFLFESKIFESGSMIYSIGDSTDYLYLIKSGTVQIHRESNENQTSKTQNLENKNPILVASCDVSNENDILNLPFSEEKGSFYFKDESMVNQLLRNSPERKRLIQSQQNSPTRSSISPRKPAQAAQKIRLSDLSEGSFFGEEEILSNQKTRSYEAKAGSLSVEVLRISEENLRMVGMQEGILERLRAFSKIKLHWRNNYATRTSQTMTMQNQNQKKQEIIGRATNSHIQNLTERQLEEERKLTSFQIMMPSSFIPPHKETSILNRRLTVKQKKKKVIIEQPTKQANKSSNDDDNGIKDIQEDDSFPNHLRITPFINKKEEYIKQYLQKQTNDHTIDLSSSDFNRFGVASEDDSKNKNQQLESTKVVNQPRGRELFSHNSFSIASSNQTNESNSFQKAKLNFRYQLLTPSVERDEKQLLSSTVDIDSNQQKGQIKVSSKIGTQFSSRFNSTGKNSNLETLIPIRQKSIESKIKQKKEIIDYREIHSLLLKIDRARKCRSEKKPKIIAEHMPDTKSNEIQKDKSRQINKPQVLLDQNEKCLEKYRSYSSQTHRQMNSFTCQIPILLNSERKQHANGSKSLKKESQTLQLSDIATPNPNQQVELEIKVNNASVNSSLDTYKAPLLFEKFSSGRKSVNLSFNQNTTPLTNSQYHALVQMSSKVNSTVCNNNTLNSVKDSVTQDIQIKTSIQKEGGKQEQEDGSIEKLSYENYLEKELRNSSQLSYRKEGSKFNKRILSARRSVPQVLISTLRGEPTNQQQTSIIQDMVDKEKSERNGQSKFDEQNLKMIKVPIFHNLQADLLSKNENSLQIFLSKDNQKNQMNSILLSPPPTGRQPMDQPAFSRKQRRSLSIMNSGPNTPQVIPLLLQVSKSQIKKTVIHRDFQQKKI